MRRYPAARAGGARRAPAGAQTACLLALIIAFLVGGVLGSFFAAHAADQTAVETFLSTPEAAADSAPAVGISAGMFFRLMLPDLAATLLLTLAAFFTFGLALAPLALAAKGFMLSLLATAFVRALGGSGYLAAAWVVTLCGFLTVAALLLLGMQAMGLALKRRTDRAYIDRGFFITVGVCVAAAALTAVLHGLFTPWMAQAIAML
jgi:hypothetical protein